MNIFIVLAKQIEDRGKKLAAKISSASTKPDNFWFTSPRGQFFLSQDISSPCYNGIS